MSGTRGATAVDVRIAGVVLWLRRGHKGSMRSSATRVHHGRRGSRGQSSRSRVVSIVSLTLSRKQWSLRGAAEAFNADRVRARTPPRRPIIRRGRLLLEYLKRSRTLTHASAKLFVSDSARWETRRKLKRGLAACKILGKHSPEHRSEA